MTTWKDNADTFRVLDTGEGWPFARLVACSVARLKQGQKLPTGSIKATAEGFAASAGTGTARVLRYLDAWDAAAERGYCAPSRDLLPEHASSAIEPDVPWGTVYRSNVGQNVTEDRKDAIRVQAQQDGTGASKAMDIASNPKALAAAIKADPATAEAARKALIQKDIADAKPIKDAIRDRGPSPVSRALGNVAATVVLTPLREFTKIMAQINQDGSVLDGATVEALKDEMHRAMTEVQVAEHRAAVEAL